MAAERLSLGCTLTDRTWALADGTARPMGIDLAFVPLGVEELFWRMLRHGEFDAAELSMASYLVSVDRGEPSFVALPVFPSRSFRHSGIFVNVDAGLEGPGDLRGARVGVPEYQLTALLWIRGLLQDEHGVAPAELRWFQGGLEEPGRPEKLALDLPDDIDLSPVPAGETLSGMLERGDLDAVFSPRPPASLGTPAVERLFPDYRAMERDYFERTGHFPIMHTVVLREDVYEATPWVAQELTKAFVAAKDRCLAELARVNALRTTLPWFHHEFEATRELMGEDYWPYGLEANRHTLETMVDYAHEQGLTGRRLDVDDLFAKETHDAFKL